MELRETTYPTGWKQVKIEELCKTFTKQTGFDYSNHIKPILVKKKTDKVIPFIQNKDFNGIGVNYNTDYFIPYDVAKRFPMILLDERCLLISISGSIGKIGVFDNKNTAFIGGAVAVGKFKNPAYLDWIKHFLLSDLGQYKLLSKVKAGSHQNLILDDIRKITLPLPPLEEQKIIASTLSNTDNLIEHLKLLILKKKALKQATMQELLTGKMRLKGFTKEWKTMYLGEVAEIKAGGTPSTYVSEYWNGNIDWFTPTEIGSSKYISTSKRKITQLGLENCSATLLPLGTILLTTRAGIGDLGILTKEACTNQGFQSFIVKKEVDNEFIYYRLKTLKIELNRKASGSTFQEISPNSLRSIRIIIPEFKEQRAISQILSDMDKEIDVLGIRLQKTQNLKQGMMQELLTGKTRLVIPTNQRTKKENILIAAEQEEAYKKNKI